MTSIARVGLGLASATGISSAVAVPLTTMNTQNNTDLKKEEPKVELTQCSQENLKNNQEVTFGKENTKNICGKGKDNNVENLEQVEDYTNLFIEKGNKKDNDDDSGRSDNSGKGTVNCTGSHVKNPGMLNNSHRGVKYLGLCENSKEKDSKFIKRQERSDKEDSTNSLTVGTCENNCGNSADKSESTNNGKQVIFYNQENIQNVDTKIV